MKISLQSFVRFVSKVPRPIYHPSCQFCAQSFKNYSETQTLHQQKMVGRTRDEQVKLVRQKPDSPPHSERLNVAILGTPNAGKSTLTNQLMGWRITSVSQKVHTTRQKIVGVFTQDQKQLIFLDTPGVVPVSAKKRHHLEESLVTDPFQVLDYADIIAVVVDVSNKYTRTKLDRLILKALLLHPERKSVLVLNKVDAVKNKDVLLTITRTLTLGQVGRQVPSDNRLHLKSDMKSTKLTQINNLGNQRLDYLSDSARSVGSDCQQSDGAESSTDTSVSPEQSTEHEVENEERMKLINKLVKKEHGWSGFDQVFMVSALSGDGVEELRDYLLSMTKPHSWSYHSSMVTDQDPVTIVKMCVWEKLLEHLPKDIPYNIHVEVPLIEVTEEGLLQLVVTIWCKDRRHVVFAIGKEGNTIKKVSSEAKQEIMNTFRCDVKMKLVVKEHKKS